MVAVEAQLCRGDQAPLPRRFISDGCDPVAGGGLAHLAAAVVCPSDVFVEGTEIVWLLFVMVVQRAVQENALGPRGRGQLDGQITDPRVGNLDVQTCVQNPKLFARLHFECYFQRLLCAATVGDVP